jgi:hypothetical protein
MVNSENKVGNGCAINVDECARKLEGILRQAKLVNLKEN